MSDKRTPKPAELTESELDTVAGGSNILTTNENITEIAKKDGKLGWSTSGDADDRPTK